VIVFEFLLEAWALLMASTANFTVKIPTTKPNTNGIIALRFMVCPQLSPVSKSRQLTIGSLQGALTRTLQGFYLERPECLACWFIGLLMAALGPME
jgi:hypothetical protein